MKSVHQIGQEHQDGKCRLDNCPYCRHPIYNRRLVKVLDMPNKRRKL